MCWRDRDAGTCGDEQPMIIDLKLLGKPFQSRVYDFGHHEWVATVSKDHDKFVSAQSIYPRFIRHGRQPLRYLLQNSVTQRVAKRIVDVFEPVEIEHRDGDWARRSARVLVKQPIEIFMQARPIGKTRQLVIMGQSAQLFLSNLPLGHVSAEKEILLFWLTPHNRPSQSHDMSMLVNVPSFKVALMSAATAQLHFAPRTVEILW